MNLYCMVHRISEMLDILDGETPDEMAYDMEYRNNLTILSISSYAILLMF